MPADRGGVDADAQFDDDVRVDADVQFDDDVRVDADVVAMRLALAEAVAAEAHGDVPVGAVVVRDGEVIASRHNERELSGDPTAHAEVLAIRDAATSVGHWRLMDCTLFVTLEPCAMCAGAIVNSRLGRVVYAATDPKAGAVASLYEICTDARLNHRSPVTAGVLADEAGVLLRSFFAARRGTQPRPTPVDEIDGGR